ncbi:MAG TPA: helix-turn-helix domain-containing protein [Caulobacteraceae bacterium]|nr:helix-turn-helix domain-containing protein [Caulobacteraceae bacterium]
MPLDDGTLVEIDRIAGRSALVPRSRRRHGLPSEGNLGEALRSLRRSLNISIEDVSRATRVSVAHLRALEDFDLARLPSRPFTLGYVRAYADTLGVDPGEAVARFKSEAPRLDTDLRPPPGVAGQARPRFSWLAVTAAAAGLALVGWNLARHATAAAFTAAPPRAAVIHLRVPTGPAMLGAPLPAPPEASTPPVYETPGLATAAASGGSADSVKAADQALKAAQAAQNVGFVTGPAGGRFSPAGRIFGAAAGAGVILQARAPTTLIVRGDDGAVYFARQLAAGEAWRAPSSDGLTIEVGEPDHVEAFANGVSKGLLTHPQTPISKLSA